MQHRSEISPARIEGNGFPLRRWTPIDAETLRQREWSGGGDVAHGVFIGNKMAGACGLHRTAASLAHAHQAAGELEEGLRLQMPEIADVVVHTEP